MRATRSNTAEQDAAAFALGTLKDSSSRDLKRLSIFRTDNVRLAAYKALYSLGDRWTKGLIEEMAKEKNLYAIAALGEIPGGEETLVNLFYSKNIQIRINACISLLKRRDLRCLGAMSDILINDIRDLSFQPKMSIGKAHVCWKVIPSASQKIKDLDVDPSL